MWSHLIADDLVVAFLSAEVDNLLELPPSDVAHTDVVDLPTHDKIVESFHCLFKWSAVVPTVSLKKKRNKVLTNGYLDVIVIGGL